MADNTWKVYEDTNGKFGIVGVTGYEQGYAELSEEDASLIAAAPELLEAARLVLAWHDAEADFSGTTFWQRVDMCRESEAALRAAVTKATGVEQ